MKLSKLKKLINEEVQKLQEQQLAVPNKSTSLPPETICPYWDIATEFGHNNGTKNQQEIVFNAWQDPTTMGYSDPDFFYSMICDIDNPIYGPGLCQEYADGTHQFVSQIAYCACCDTFPDIFYTGYTGGTATPNKKLPKKPLKEQVKNRLQKLAGIDSEKRATPKRRGGDFIDYSDSNESDIWYGCSVCDESTAFPGETSCLPLVPFEIDLVDLGDSVQSAPNAYDVDYGVLASGECNWCFEDLIGSDGQPYVSTDSSPSNIILNANLLFNDEGVAALYSPEEFCSKGTNETSNTQETCSDYPAACCLQQLGSDYSPGNTITYGGEEVIIPSAEECEGITIISTNTTPWPHGTNTSLDGVEYTHNPNNTFEQGCCYHLH